MGMGFLRGMRYEAVRAIASYYNTSTRGGHMTYRPLEISTVTDYIRDTALMGSIFSKNETLVAEDLADGNVNLVFRVSNGTTPSKTASVIVKQALPYARAVGESFPMPLKRISVEHHALTVQAQYCPQWVPRVYYYDEEMALMVMEDLNQHVIMRKGMMQQVQYPQFARHLGLFLARSLFYTSDLYCASEVKKQQVSLRINPELCRVTEDLVFTHPFIDHPGNHWNPRLTEEIHEIRKDSHLLAQIMDLKDRFMTHAEALIHGDLHTGSIMLNQDDTAVIDPEFSFYGPMAFDVGSLLGNLAISYVAQGAYGLDTKTAAEYRRWIAESIRTIWTVFSLEFRSLWSTNAQSWNNEVYMDQYLHRLLRESIGFGGIEIIRRIVGLAHTVDLEHITDNAMKTYAEITALRMGRLWIQRSNQLTHIDELLSLIREVAL